jgi:PhzF family phenazine biosynthesis protein
MSQRVYQIDAFASEPFAGNPAAVMLLQKPAEEAWMQQVAMEMNLSETAFLHRAGDVFHLRWFTPKAEVELCGHATLASAHMLWEEGHIARDAVARFQTLSGELRAQLSGDTIELDFPIRRPQAVEPPDGLLGALGVEAKAVRQGGRDYLVEVADEPAVRRASPDFGVLKTVKTRGVMITAPADSNEFHFVSRFFAPAMGIDEDPVTGSAHCLLTAYWSEKLGITEMTAFQASTRGGVVKVRLDGERVFLGGTAVTVMRGELITP